VHSAPAYGLEDFDSCRKHGMHNDEILTPVQGDGRYASSLPFFGGLNVWKANPVIVEKLREVGALFASSTDHPQLHALLAPQDADHLPRHHAVVRRHGPPGRTA
jgi:isoleucyl-tRNA synthetase